ncbi:conserved unknown protein [Ectocarpus siliculosus]|uniref:PPM-type phosphatase domain-containing protein n=1 Tax=Ectocarpus siliculosus TaxID=2880 RepID=D7FIW4_ECTSI|nr:conserved unknown protein [Ectocarpus siliculosus]|eukprot:CBJ28912.1 conserved unknown protein [Ectocarpus siliculosus]
MGVFLSKPSVTKFSEDGEDSDVGFGVSSMQGWRRNMEDAHLALLDLQQHPQEGGERQGGGEEVRMFGVFDGHGGKEVALFVQEHMAKELVKLEEYRSGDYPRALARVFHRMDELLEGAATELVRSRGPSQRMLPDGHDGGETSRASGGAQQLLTLGESSQSEAERGVGGDATKDKEGEEEKETRSEEKEGVTTGVADMETEMASAELYKVICQELAEYRSRKNPSDEEAEEPPSKAAANPILGSGQDYDSDEEDAGVGGDGSSGGHRNRKDKVGVVDASAADSGDNDVLELGSGGPNGGGGRKIKMADALELFHRILDIRKDQQRNAAADAAATTGAGSDPTSVGGGKDDDASTCPTPLPSDTACDGGGKPRGAGNGSEQVAPSEGGMGGEAVSAGEPGGSGEGAAAAAAAASPAEEKEEGEDRGALLPAGGAGQEEEDEEEGEDTFGDSDESEEDDVVVTASPAGGGGGSPGEGAAARPRLGLGSSLASIVHGQGGNAPTCSLQDHPIQAGCTSVVCLMVGKVLHVANAGDSRAVLCRGGVAVALSHDHKPMSVTEKRRIEGAGGFVNAAGRVNGNLNLSRSIGDLKYKANKGLPPADQMITAEPDLKSVEVTDEDRFMILACDGVWDCMTSQECVDFVGARVGKMSLSKVCEEVMDECMSDDPRRTTGIGGDNMTCIVVLLDKTFSAETLPPRGEETKDSADEDPSGAAVEEGGAGASSAGSGTAVGDAAAVAGDEAPAVSLEEGKE